MRIILVGVFLVLFAIISLPLYLVTWLLGKKDERLQVAFSQKIVKVAFRIIFILAGARIECKGRENVPKDEAVLYIANHRSYCDILAGYITTPTLTGFVSKDDLKKVPCVSRWMRFLKCLFLIRHHFAWFSPTKVSVVYGEPIYPKDLTAEEKRHMGAYMQKKVEEMLENID